MLRTKSSLSLRFGLCAALVSGLLFTGGGTSLARCETVWLDVYDVRVEVGRKTYHFGETAVVEATVTRTDTGSPVEGADFVAIVTGSRKGWIFGWDDTDATGRATARLKLKKSRFNPGPVKLRAIGFKETADAASCAQVVEYGEKRLRRAFVVKP